MIEDEGLQQDAVEYARRNKKRIARQLTDQSIYPPEAEPVSVFMAGSPGAGKTEASKVLLSKLEAPGAKVLRIDPDELRDEIPGYSGSNSWAVQGAVSVLVERIHDCALKQSQSFLLDGTFANYDKARHNVERSLAKGRAVQILYVYQEPMQAWSFVLAREALEGRNIRPEDFTHQYFSARQTVNRMKADFGRDVAVDLLVKNNDGSQRFYKFGVDKIDNHVPEKYSPADVERMLKRAT